MFTKKHKKMIFALANIHKEIDKFIKDIVRDSHPNIEEIRMNIGLDYPYYKIGFFSTKTKSTVTKHYDANEFLQMCIDKKIEMELNMTIRKMLLKLEEGEKGNIKL